MQLFFGLWLAVLAAGGSPAADWNDAGIRWRPFDAGLAEARQASKPVCLVFFTTWCPHCHNYSRVFSAAGVEKLATEFVMIRLDKDKHPDISKRFAPDGEYIPRTYFLTPDGAVMKDVTAPRDSYRYFYDERDPASLVGGMKRALKSMAPRHR